jgi:hypothetical protein
MSTPTRRTTRASTNSRTKRASSVRDNDPNEKETKKSKATTAKNDTKTKKREKKEKEPSHSDPPVAGGDEPWYTVFTKGDEHYTEYMKNEWGREKVCNNR